MSPDCRAGYLNRAIHEVLWWTLLLFSLASYLGWAHLGDRHLADQRGMWASSLWNESHTAGEAPEMCQSCSVIRSFEYIPLHSSLASGPAEGAKPEQGLHVPKTNPFMCPAEGDGVHSGTRQISGDLFEN